MNKISWKDVLHYGGAAVLFLLGILGTTGLQIPGVQIDPVAAFAGAIGIFGAGLKSTPVSGK